MRKFITLTLLGTVLAASSAFGAITTFNNDLAGFLGSSIVGANGVTFTENFNTNTSLFTTFSVANGAFGVGLPGYSGGLRNDRVQVGTNEVVTLNAGNMTAFGGTFDLSPGGLGSGVTFTLNLVGGGQQTVLLTSGVNSGAVATLGYNVGNGSGPIFFGFTSDTAFTSVVMAYNSTTGSNGETFNIDDLLIEQVGTNGTTGTTGTTGGTVPEPSTFGMSGLALAGLGLVRRKR